MARIRIGVAYRWRHGFWPDLDRPRLFTEWVQWRKLNDRDDGLARLTDKLHAKQLASDRLGEALVIPTLWHGRELPLRPAWPMPFIVKANHGCNQFLVVRTPADWQRARRTAPRWLRAPYGRWLDEWHYTRARRTLLIEPFIGPATELPIDYKIYVFNGVAKIVQLHFDRLGNHRWVQFDRHWRRVSARDGIPDPTPPVTLAAMLTAAEAIAGDRDHLRVDFYEVGGKIWFGETCLFPGSGLDRFNPTELDLALGRLWAGRSAELICLSTGEQSRDGSMSPLTIAN